MFWSEELKRRNASARPEHRQKNSVKNNLKEIWQYNIDWINLAQVGVQVDFFEHRNQP
jgi:hypothetical protein